MYVARLISNSNWSQVWLIFERVSGNADQIWGGRRELSRTCCYIMPRARGTIKLNGRDDEISVVTTSDRSGRARMSLNIG